MERAFSLLFGCRLMKAVSTTEHGPSWLTATAIIFGATSLSTVIQPQVVHADGWMSEQELNATLAGKTVEGIWEDGTWFSETYQPDGRIENSIGSLGFHGKGDWNITADPIPFRSGVLCKFGDCWRVRRITNCFGLFSPKEPDVKPLHVRARFQLKDGLPCFNSQQLGMLRKAIAAAREVDQRRALSSKAQSDGLQNGGEFFSRVAEEKQKAEAAAQRAEQETQRNFGKRESRHQEESRYAERRAALAQEPIEPPKPTTDLSVLEMRYIEGPDFPTDNVSELTKKRIEKEALALASCQAETKNKQKCERDVLRAWAEERKSQLAAEKEKRLAEEKQKAEAAAREVEQET